MSPAPVPAAAPALPLRDDAQVIGLVGLAHGVSHFFHLIVAPLFPWLGAEFALSNIELGLLMSVFFVVSGTGQALAGFVVDRVGAYPVLLCGVALLTVSAVVLALAPSYGVLIAGAAIAGAGNSVFHPSDYTLLGKRVSSPRMAYAFSVHGLTGTLGWAIAPVFLVGIAHHTTWRTALIGAACLAAAVLAALVLAHRVLDDRRVARGDAKRPDASTAHVGALDFLRLPAVWLCFAFFAITAMALGGVQSFAPTALRDLYGVPLALATGAITAFMLASAAGTIVGGFIAARVAQHERVVAVAMLGAAAMSLFVASGIPAGAWLVLPFVVMGFGAGISGPSRDLLVRAAAPANATGRVFGVVYSGLDIGLAISPLMFGALMDAQRLPMVFVLIGVFQAGALVTALGVGQRRRPPAPASIAAHGA
jgi:MFS family permease